MNRQFFFVKSTLARMLKIIHYTLPIFMTNLLGMIAGFCMTIMLAKLGKNELAALAIANTFYITVTACVASCLYAVSILISKNYAMGRPEAMAQIIRSGLGCCVILGVPAAILLWNGSHLLLLFGQSPELVASTVTFFHFAAFTMFPMLCGALISQYYNGTGKPVMTSIIMLCQLPFILGFSYFFILGPAHLGLAGSPAAMLISQCLTVIGAILYIRRGKHWKELISRDIPLYDWTQIKQIFSIGIHIGLQFLGELSAMSAAMLLMGRLGSVALASSQIVTQYILILVMFNLAVSQAVSIKVSQAFGEKRFHLIDKYMRATAYLVIALFVLFGIVYVCMPLRFISLFANVHDLQNADLIHLSHKLMLIAIVVMMIDGMRNILTSSLRGLQNAKAPMMLGILGLWVVSVPMSYLLGIALHGGPVLLRMGFGFGFLVTVIVLFFYYQNYKRKISR